VWANSFQESISKLNKDKTVSAWKQGGGGEREGVGGKRRGGGKGGVMTQSLYAHMNKGNFKKSKK
jgi:hypothetical protein